MEWNISLVHPYWLKFDPAPTWFHYIVGSIVFLLTILSVVGNSVVICIYLKFPKLNPILCSYVLSLAASDLFSALTTYWMIIYSSFREKWIFGTKGCTVYGFIQGYCALQSITVVSVIAFERTVSLRRPNPVNSAHKNRMLILAWVYPLFMASPPVFGWSQYTLDGILTTCCFEIMEKSWEVRSFIIFITLVGFCVPLGITVLSYCHFVLVIIRMPRFGQTKQNKRKYLKPLKLVFIVVVCFLVAWTPYALVTLIAQFGPPDVVTPELITVVGLLAKSSTALNPVIYSTTDSAFIERLKGFKNTQLMKYSHTKGVEVRT